MAGAYHAWRGEPSVGEYRDVPGFCEGARLEEISAQGYVLTPGRYVGAAQAEEDDEPLEEKMRRRVSELEAQFAVGARLPARIRANLRASGYGH